MRRLLVSCCLLLLIPAILAVVGLNQVSRYFWQSPARDAVAQDFSVAAGQSFIVIAQGLAEQNLIANAMWLRITAELAGMTDSVKVGTYQLTPGQNYRTILETLTAGSTSTADVRVTIPEGYTLKQMGELLAAEGLVAEADWAVATGQFSPLEAHPFVVSALKPDGVDFEGYLFPDTYRFAVDATAEEIAEIMLDNLAARVEKIGQPRGDAEGMSLHEVLTLASIVEREVRQPDTMKNVADIFLKRLDIGMALQADSTVNYVTGGDSPSITLAERDNTDSPYNTYKYPGLPPGPISAPGLNAIEAVLDPIHNDYFYFLTTDSGQIYYAVTHDQHVENKNRYLK
jgi:UPF0755 protein